MLVCLIGGVALSRNRPCGAVAKSSSATASDQALLIRILTEASATLFADMLLTLVSKAPSGDAVPPNPGLHPPPIGR